MCIGVALVINITYRLWIHCKISAQIINVNRVLCVELRKFGPDYVE